MADPTPLNRNQIAAFVGNDSEVIRGIERLFVVAGQNTPAEIFALKQDVGAAANTAEVALSTATDAERMADLVAKGPLSDAHNSVATDYVELNVNAPLPADKPGRAYWNRDDGTMDIDLYGGSVLQVGQEIHFYSKNTSGGLIANGTPVMFTGTVGASGKLEFGLAVANGSVPADYMMGVTTQNVADNEFGYVTNFGLVRGFNTTGTPYGEVWADGDLLYFDPATPGTWTNVKPAAPNISVPVAVVINAGSGGSGSIFVRMKISESLNNLQDVYINGTGTPLAGEVLIYDATQARWENHHITPGANITITNADGAITIAVSGLGTMAFENIGATGSFLAGLQTVTVVNGIITSIV